MTSDRHRNLTWSQFPQLTLVGEEEAIIPPDSSLGAGGQALHSMVPNSSMSPRGLYAAASGGTGRGWNRDHGTYRHRCDRHFSSSVLPTVSYP